MAGSEGPQVIPSTRAPACSSGRIQTFLLSNIQRLITPTGRTKTKFLSDQAALKNALLVAVTETWLHNGVFDAEVTHDFPGYSIFRCDRVGRQGGGVALYLRDDLTGEILCSEDNGVCELLAVRVHQLNTVIAVLYRPPDTRITEFLPIVSKLDNILSELEDPTPNIVLMGDFNFQDKNLSWIRSDDGLLVPLVHGHRQLSADDGVQVRQQAAKLCDVVLKHSMIQQVDQATHGREILDLLFSNNEDLVSSVSAESWPTFTDHSIVTANVSYQLEKDKVIEETHLLDSGKRLKKLNFNKAPWQQIQAELRKLDWEPMKELAKESSTAAHSWFMETLIPLLENLVPLKVPRRGKSNKLQKRRKLLWKKLGKVIERIETSSSTSKLSKLIQDKWELEKQLKDHYSSLNCQEESQAVLHMKDNPKAFFSFARSRQKTRSRVGPFIDPVTGHPNSDPDFAASVLADQYKSVFVQPRPEWTVNDVKEFFGSGGEGPALADINFNATDMEVACSELSSSSAAGADGVPASLLKTCRKELRTPLFILWRASLNQGLIPPDLLLVLVCPVHKGGSRGSPKNYRPVALTSHLTKVFERVVRKTLVDHLEKHGLLPDTQHGFRALRSTLTQLLSYWDTLLEDMEMGKGVDVIYTDFSKAFDTVETGVLLHELKQCGVTGKVGCWLSSFLDSKNRHQAVAVDGRVSPLTPVLSGVPQGTVLGPVLFLVHIRNISRGLSEGTSSSSFADDTRVQRGVSSASDCSALQSDLESIYTWANEVNMTFNSEKFECLRYWADPDKAPPFQYLAPDSQPIEVKTDLRDLGVRISSNLSFSIHIENVVTAASKLVGWGLRTFHGRGRAVMLTLLKSLVQPKLDYCSQLWSPSDQSSINRIESVQRHLVDRITDRKLIGLNYWEKLSELHLYSQERRRERYQVIFIWKISQGMVSGYDLNFIHTKGRRGRSVLPKTVVRAAPSCVRNARERSLGVRGARIFNLLPEELRSMNTDHIDMFKNHLDVFLSSIPDQPTLTGLGRAAESNSLLHQLPLFYTQMT